MTESTYSTREFARFLFHITFDLLNPPNTANVTLLPPANYVMRRVATVLERTLAQANELKLEYGLTANHLHALSAVMSGLVKVPDDYTMTIIRFLVTTTRL